MKSGVETFFLGDFWDHHFYWSNFIFERILLQLMHMKKKKGFQLSSFFCTL